MKFFVFFVYLSRCSSLKPINHNLFECIDQKLQSNPSHGFVLNHTRKMTFSFALLHLHVFLSISFVLNQRYLFSFLSHFLLLLFVLLSCLFYVSVTCSARTSSPPLVLLFYLTFSFSTLFRHSSFSSLLLSVFLSS